MIEQALINLFIAPLLVSVVLIVYHGYWYRKTGWWINLIHIITAFAIIGMSFYKISQPQVWYSLT